MPLSSHQTPPWCPQPQTPLFAIQKSLWYFHFENHWLSWRLFCFGCHLGGQRSLKDWRQPEKRNIEEVIFNHVPITIYTVKQLHLGSTLKPITRISILTCWCSTPARGPDISRLMMSSGMMRNLLQWLIGCVSRVGILKFISAPMQNEKNGLARPLGFVACLP